MLLPRGEESSSAGSASTDRQAAFDRRYRLLELRERRADRELRRKEVELSRGSGLSLNAGQATVAAALLALISAVVGGGLQGYFGRTLEVQKQQAAERLERAKFETTLILKATEAADRDTQVRNLKFFLDAGFIGDPEGKIRRIGEAAYPSSPPPAAAAPNAVLPDRVAAGPLARRVSVEALNLLVASEIGSRSVYEARLSHPVLAAGGGITIGIGYDLAFATEGRFRGDWAGHLRPEEVEALRPFLGIRDQDTLKGAVQRLAGITVSWDAAVDVFLDKTLPEVDARLRAVLPNLDLLPPEAHGALLVLAYNQGTGFNAQAGMRAIRLDMENRNFSAIPGRIRSMKSSAENGSGRVARRREMEAALFEKGFPPVAGTAE